MKKFQPHYNAENPSESYLTIDKLDKRELRKISAPWITSKHTETLIEGVDFKIDLVLKNKSNGHSYDVTPEYIAVPISYTKDDMLTMLTKFAVEHDNVILGNFPFLGNKIKSWFDNYMNQLNQNS